MCRVIDGAHHTGDRDQKQAKSEVHFRRRAISLTYYERRHYSYLNAIRVCPRFCEHQQWAVSPATQWLLEAVPAGVHFRPRGEQDLLLIWTFEDHAVENPVYPPPYNPHYGEVLIRGLADMIPGLHVYFGRGHAAQVDGGYYCKTPENRPLIGPPARSRRLCDRCPNRLRSDGLAGCRGFIGCPCPG